MTSSQESDVPNRVKKFFEKTSKNLLTKAKRYGIIYRLSSQDRKQWYIEKITAQQVRIEAD